MRRPAYLRQSAPLPNAIRLHHPSGPIDVALKANTRAKRLILRLDSKTGEPVATCPPGISTEKIGKFLQDHVDWLVEKQQSRLPNTAFEHGAIVPVRGIPHLLEHVDEARGTVRHIEEIGQNILLVSGNESHMNRRVTDWMKKQARADLNTAVSIHAERIGLRPSALKIKDTTSRWGSCSANRSLSFSWRIIMAPPHVLNYLAAHEVAHFKEMNHSDRFWAHVAALCPDFESGRKWLREHGRQLHSYGID